MASWSNIFITNKGKEMIASALAGQKLTFIKIAAGDGQLTGGMNASEIDSMINEVVSVTPTQIKKTNNYVEIKAAFGAEFKSKSFYFREIGVFAKIDNDTPFLLAYGNSGSTADFIDGVESSSVIEKVINIVLVVNTNADIDINVNSNAFVTHEQLKNGNYELNVNTTKTGELTTNYVSGANIEVVANTIVTNIASDENLTGSFFIKDDAINLLNISKEGCTIDNINSIDLTVQDSINIEAAQLNVNSGDVRPVLSLSHTGLTLETETLQTEIDYAYINLSNVVSPQAHTNKFMIHVDESHKPDGNPIFSIVYDKTAGKYSTEIDSALKTQNIECYDVSLNSCDVKESVTSKNLIIKSGAKFGGTGDPLGSYNVVIHQTPPSDTPDERMKVNGRIVASTFEGVVAASNLSVEGLSFFRAPTIFEDKITSQSLGAGCSFIYDESQQKLTMDFMYGVDFSMQFIDTVQGYKRLEIRATSDYKQDRIAIIDYLQGGNKSFKLTGCKFRENLDGKYECTILSENLQLSNGRIPGFIGKIAII